MASPTPKDPAHRRNRSKPRGGEWKPSAGYGWQHGRTPACPRGVSQETQDAWKLWMSGYAMSNLHPGDLPALTIIARLHDAVTKGDFTRAPELRLWLDSYGLTPKGQQARRWKPPGPPEARSADPHSRAYALSNSGSHPAADPASCLPRPDFGRGLR